MKRLLPNEITTLRDPDLRLVATACVRAGIGMRLHEVREHQVIYANDWADGDKRTFFDPLNDTDAAMYLLDHLTYWYDNQITIARHHVSVSIMSGNKIIADVRTYFAYSRLHRNEVIRRAIVGAVAAL